MKNFKEYDTLLNKNQKQDHVIFPEFKSQGKIKFSLVRNGSEEITLPQVDLDFIYPLIQVRLSDKMFKGEKEVKLQLPSTINAELLVLYIHVLRRKSFKSADIDECIDLLKVTDFFQDKETASMIVNESIINLLDKSNCLEILQEFTEKIYNHDENKSIYLNLVQMAIDHACKNVFFLINTQYDLLMEMNIDTVESIIERYFERVVFSSGKEEYMQVIDLLAKRRNLHNVFDLLENERKRSIITFNNYLAKEKTEPFIVWKVISENSSLGYYKESEPFSFENVDKYEFVMINYYNAESDSFSIAIKVSEQKQENEQGLYLSLLSMIKIKEIQYESKINFNCLMLDFKSRVLLCKIDKFSSLFANEGLNTHLEFTIEIFFNLSSSFTGILSHICKNFYMYNSLSSVSKLSKNLLSLILKNSHLNVKNEDEKLTAVKNWRLGKDEKICACEDLYKTIVWENVTLDALLEFIINDSKTLLNSNELQKVLIREFQRRFRNEYYNSKKKHSENELLGNHSLVDEPAPTSFTSELISKLIKIASKYENNSRPMNRSAKLSHNNSLVFNKDKNSNQIVQKIEKNPMENSQNVFNFVDPLEKKTNLQTLNEFSFIAKSSGHMRNLSNSNNHDLLNDTFKKLSNNLSVSLNKTINKSYNISPKRRFKGDFILNKKRPDPNQLKKVVYTTTQTNITSTNNNSYLATENKCTYPPGRSTKPTTLSKTKKMPTKPKKKKDEKSSITNFYGNVINCMRTFEHLKFGRVNADKKSKPYENSINYNTNFESRPKSVCLLKKKPIQSNILNNK